MKRRIEKLFNEAGFHKPEVERLGIEHKFEKFAELIVLECMNICAEREEDIRTRIRDERQAATAYMCRAYIKEHFGVKE